MSVRVFDAENAGVSGPPSSPVRLLVLDEGPGAGALRRAVAASPQGRVLDLRALAAGYAEAFTREFRDFVAELNRADGGPDWWAFRLHEKNPLFSSLPERCHRLGLVLRAAAEPGGELWVCTADAVLARQLALWGEANGAPVSGSVRAREPWKARLNRLLPGGPLVAFARALARLARARRLFRFVPEPGRRYSVIATLINHQSFDAAGRYRDTYFGDLERYLSEAGRSPLTFGSVTHDATRSMARAAAHEGPGPVLPMEAFLGYGALVGLLWRALRLRYSDLPLSRAPVFAGADVGLLVREDLRANARASRLYSDLWYRACAEALLRRVSVETIFFPFENRVWERMIVLAARELSPGTRLVGYQHSSMTDFHLNLMLGRGEAERLPLPDELVANGEVTRRWLRERGGFPERMLRAGCALRLLPPRPVAQGRAAAARRLLVILATSAREAARVLRLLDEAFGGGGDASGEPPRDAPELLLRPHPTIPLADGLALCGPVRFRYRLEPGWSLQQSLDWCDTTLFASSTAGIEAVRQGIPAVFLDITDFLRTDPIADFTELKWSARTAPELRAALAAIAGLGERELSERRAAAARYCARYHAAITPETLAPLTGRAAVGSAA